MARPRKPPDPAVRARIVSAASALLDSQGVKGATLANIAKQASIAYGTLYRYFPDRNSLLLEALASQTSAVEQEWLMAASGEDPVDALIELCWAPLKPLIRSPGRRDVHTANLVGHATVIEGASAEVERMAAVGRRLMVRRIREAKRQGQFPGLAEDVLVTALLGIPGAYLSTIYVPNEPNWPRVRKEIEHLVRRLAGEKVPRTGELDGQKGPRRSGPTRT